MATHSSVLAWRIPGTGEPGGLPSMGLHRVGHDWNNLAAAAAAADIYPEVELLDHMVVLFLVFWEASSCFPHGLPWWLSGKESTSNAGDVGDHLQCRRCRLNPWVRKIPWRRKWQPTPVFLPGKFHGQRSLAGYSSWGCKELDTTEQLNHPHSVFHIARTRETLKTY